MQKFLDSSVPLCRRFDENGEKSHQREDAMNGAFCINDGVVIYGDIVGSGFGFVSCCC